MKLRTIFQSTSSNTMEALVGACGVAALNGFTPVGIEIQSELIDAARSMAKDLALPTVFA